MERVRAIIEERFFPLTYKERREIPVVPPSALAEYQRLKREWLIPYPKIAGIEPGLCLHPAKTTEVIGYILTKELTFLLSKLN